ncbi:MAG: DsrE family protein [Methanomassiliicoccales archaeon]|nr:MAG: DsrE family protein [Methanomassiliicoccales archaeon]
MANSICVLIRKAPYGMEDAFAGLRLGLATIASGIETKIVLLEDGVFCGMKRQITENIGMPCLMNTLDDLVSLDVKIYCVEDDLEPREIEKSKLMDEMKFITENELSDLILSCDAVTSF